MKIAIAMLCHKNVEQINALLRVMAHDDIYFYIHVDKKSNIDRKKITGKNVNILARDKSVDVQWGGFGMIEATLQLIRKINRSEEEYDYIWLMSGQDYPLHLVEEIVAYFKQYKGEDFIEILQDEEAFNRGYFKRNELYYPKWMVSNNIYIKIIKHLLWSMTGGKKSTKVFKRKTKIEHFYYGSQWWVLSKQSLQVIMDFLDKNSWYVEYFRNSLVPDECFFQTIYGMIIGREKAKKSVCYVNWQDNRNSPEVLTCRDMEKIVEVKNKYLIARKFDFDVDSNIIQMISQREKSKI